MGFQQPDGDLFSILPFQIHFQLLKSLWRMAYGEWPETLAIS